MRFHETVAHLRWGRAHQDNFHGARGGATLAVRANPDGVTAARVGNKPFAISPRYLRFNVYGPASRSPRKLYHAAGLLSLVSVQTLNEDILSAAVLITIICDGCHILRLLYCHKLHLAPK